MQVSSGYIGQKKELKRIEWNMVRRLISLLHCEGKMKKTNLAMKCNMSYDKCILYLNWLELLELIKKEKDDEGFELIILHDRGKKIFNTFTQPPNFESFLRI